VFSVTNSVAVCTTASACLAPTLPLSGSARAWAAIVSGAPAASSAPASQACGDNNLCRTADLCTRVHFTPGSWVAGRLSVKLYTGDLLGELESARLCTHRGHWCCGDIRIDLFLRSKPRLHHLEAVAFACFLILLPEIDAVM